MDQPASSAVPIALEVEELTKDYHLKGETVRALRGVTFKVQTGEYIAVMGPSGSGKSTLLNLLGCLDRPSAGRYILGNQNVAMLNDDQLSHVRASKIGFVFQSYNLIPQLNIIENIQVPLQYQGAMDSDADERCRELADLVGLGDRIYHRPTELSGGQQQRVAIARSLKNQTDPCSARKQSVANEDAHAASSVIEHVLAVDADVQIVVISSCHCLCLCRLKVEMIRI